MSGSLQALLDDVAQGRVSVEAALERLKGLPFELVRVGAAQVATVDHHRPLLQGTPEVVYGEGKTPAEVRAVAEALLGRGRSLLVTRASADAFAATAEVAPDAVWHERARIVSVLRGEAPPPLGRVAVVCAGTSDLAVAEEAAITAEHFGMSVERVTDVGVAGLGRVLAARERIDAADVVVVVAGMEGALPSVIGGLTSRPVVAVPTSVGYGASFGGLAALLSMLNACSSGLTVVNIDNGFGAAMAARRILAAPPSSARRRVEQASEEE